MLKLIDRRFGSSQEVTLRFHRYQQGGAIAIQMVCAETGEPWATATVNLPGQVPEDCVAIKNYAEGAGMDALLIQAGVIEPKMVGMLHSGFVEIPIHPLTPSARTLASLAN